LGRGSGKENQSILMKIGIISNSSGNSWAGSEVLWHDSSLKALNQGHQVTAFLHQSRIPLKPVIEFQNQGGLLKTWRKMRIARFQVLKERLIPTFSLSELNSHDVLLISLGSLPTICYVPGLASALMSTKTPFVILCQFNSDHIYISPSERDAISRVMALSRSCLFVSQRNLNEAVRQFSIHPPDARVISNPTRNKADIACPWPDEMDGFSFASVARMEVAWKGQDILFEVLSRPQWRARKWRLRLYGEGPDRPYLERLSRFYNLEDRISFEGHVSNLMSIWSQNHLLVMPSHGEGTPLAALEAMMAGRPVVATDVGGNAEVINDEETGFIAPASTVNSIASTMERAWNQREKWEEMGLKARAQSENNNKSDPALQIISILCN